MAAYSNKTVTTAIKKKKQPSSVKECKITWSNSQFVTNKKKKHPTEY